MPAAAAKKAAGGKGALWPLFETMYIGRKVQKDQDAGVVLCEDLTYVMCHAEASQNPPRIYTVCWNYDSGKPTSKDLESVVEEDLCQWVTEEYHPAIADGIVMKLQQHNWNKYQGFAQDVAELKTKKCVEGGTGEDRFIKENGGQDGPMDDEERFNGRSDDEEDFVQEAPANPTPVKKRAKKELKRGRPAKAAGAAPSRKAAKRKATSRDADVEEEEDVAESDEDGVEEEDVMDVEEKEVVEVEEEEDGVEVEEPPAKKAATRSRQAKAGPSTSAVQTPTSPAKTTGRARSAATKSAASVSVDLVSEDTGKRASRSKDTQQSKQASKKAGKGKAAAGTQDEEGEEEVLEVQDESVVNGSRSSRQKSAGKATGSAGPSKTPTSPALTKAKFVVSSTGRKIPAELCCKPGDKLVNERSEEDDADDEFEFDQILDSEVRDGQQYYLLKWKGYELDVLKDWEPEGNVSKGAVKKWKAKQEQEAGQGTPSQGASTGGKTASKKRRKF